MNALLADTGTLWSVSIWGLLCAAAATLWWRKARIATLALLALALAAAFVSYIKKKNYNANET